MPATLRVETSASNTRLRIDKWLFHARFCRTRALAQAKARAGAIRINGQRVDKPSAEVSPGDIVTLAIGREILVIRGARSGRATRFCCRGTTPVPTDLAERLIPSWFTSSSMFNCVIGELK